MKIKTRVAGSIGVAVLAGITAISGEVFTVTDPHVVGPLASSIPSQTRPSRSGEALDCGSLLPLSRRQPAGKVSERVT